MHDHNDCTNVKLTIFFSLFLGVCCPEFSISSLYCLFISKYGASTPLAGSVVSGGPERILKTEGDQADGGALHVVLL